MKIQIASDLHLDVREDRQPSCLEFRSVADRDVLVLAGDIGSHSKTLAFIEQEVAFSPVIYVPGNHEYHSGQPRGDVDAVWHRTAEHIENLHYLVCEGVTIDGVRFFGAPWYSDLFGRRDHAYLVEVEHTINDFDEKYHGHGGWSVVKHLREHASQTELLRAQAGQVDVVITHWPPTKRAIACRFAGHALNGYFVNDRENLVKEIGARLWVSGHVHDSYDCVLGATRCLGNPTGFPGQLRKWGGFRPDRVIEV